jgi:hypothetical protein
MKNILKTWLHRKQNVNWYKITVNQFIELSKYGDKLTTEDAVRIIYNKDYNNIPLSEISKYNLSFLKTEVPRETIKKYYKINGTKYFACFDTTKLTTAQFVDFQNYAKQNDFIGCLSVCFRPKGTEYNDGSYDIDKVKQDIASLPITQGLTIAFFFKNQLVVLLSAIQSSLANQLEEIPETRKLAEIIETLDLANLEYYR